MIVSIPEQDAPRDAYEQFLLTQLSGIRSLARSVARSQRLSAAQTQDFIADVLVHFIEKDYAVLRKFRRKCSLRTFLSVVIKRLCLDARIAEWGKWRPSAHSRRAGEIVVMIERLTMRDGLTFDEACAILRTNHKLVFDDRALERHVGGFHPRSRPHFVRHEGTLDEPVSGATADRSLLDRDADRALGQAAAAMTATFQSLPALDREILTLHFRDGLTVASIARSLGRDQKQLHRRFACALKRMRKSLEAAHVRKPEVLGAIGRPDVAAWRLFGASA